MLSPEIRQRVDQYAKSNNIILVEEVGYGTDGAVWKSNRNTAVKALEREIAYFNERDAYRRLAEYGFTQISFDFPPVDVYYSSRLDALSRALQTAYRQIRQRVDQL